MKAHIAHKLYHVFSLYFIFPTGEKLMKAVFNLARILQPAVIFFDEIDALMSARKVNTYCVRLSTCITVDASDCLTVSQCVYVTV